MGSYGQSLDMLERELQRVLRQLHWGAAGLELMFCQQEVSRVGETRDKLQTVLEVVASAAAHDRFVAAGTALATDLATRLSCDRVSVGFMHNGQIRIDAVSHSAQFKERTNLMRAIATAMDEAVDQNATVAVPPPSGSSPLVRRAHDALIDKQGSGACCTVVMTSLGKPAGAITLERVANRPFDSGVIELCEAVAALAGPMLEVVERYKGVEQFLTARRLVEAGVGCVTLSVGNWDTHGQNFQTLKRQLPIVDKGVANLIQDLHDRGMADDVVTVMWGEFGRTPKINGSAGRDHWAPVMSAIVAGGGLKMGQTIGASTAKTPHDVATPFPP